MYKAVVTGIGVISCLGNDCPAALAALMAGRSGVGLDPERAAMGFRSALTGLVRGFDPAAFLGKKQRKTMPDFAVWAYAAALEALAMARLAPDALRNGESGLIFGSDSSCLAAVEQVDALRAKADTALIGSGQIFRAMNSTITMNLNTLLKTRGACWTLSAACSSSGHAVGQAADLIRLGRQERVICGGAQEITWQGLCSFDGLGAFSLRADAPEQASRPFDAQRDGLVPSGGAAVLVLERKDLAEQRGAAILAEVAGYGFSSDGEHISIPSRSGMAQAMRKALADAGLAAQDVDCLSAHATSTPAGDAAEAYNIKAVFGQDCPPVVCFKGLTGHELWMAGAAQVVYGTLMARHGFLAANPNFQAPDQDTAGLPVITKTTPVRLKNMLCNAAGFGGANSCLALRFPE
jgi:3-oxoacyl-[acyl-carrier-protein] synthase-1